MTAGCGFLVIGGALVLPLTDLLPVDTWDWLNGVFSQQEHSSFTELYRPKTTI